MFGFRLTSETFESMSSPEPEIPFTSGRLTNDVVRVGQTVRRPLKSSSAFVGLLLRHFETRGDAWAPRHLGQDAQGREVLSFIAGSTPVKWRRFADQQIQAAARLVRSFHDATRWSQLSGGKQVVCHNDLGPNNFVFQEERPVAIIDFDMAAPGDPLEDIGYMAWAWCVSSKPDRQPSLSQAQQIRIMVDAYAIDGVSRCRVVESMLERQDRNVHFWTEKLSDPNSIPTSVEKIRELIDWSRREHAYTQENRQVFEEVLCRG